GRSAVELLAASALCAICLLPLYHRDYDILLLVPALLWSVRELISSGSRIAGAVLIAMLIFCLPIEGIFQMFARVGWLPKSWEGTSAWQAAIVASYAWITLLISALLV